MSLVPSIASRYIARLCVARLLITLLALVVTYGVFDLIESWRFFSFGNASTSTVLGYYADRLPGLLVQSMPPAMLIAALLTLSALARHGELMGLYAAGLSPRRLLLPLVAVAVAAGAVSLAAAELWEPQAAERSATIMRGLAVGRSPEARALAAQRLARNGRFFVYARDGGEVPSRVTVFEMGAEFRPLRRWDAARMRHAGATNGWWLEDATVREFPLRPRAAGPAARAVLLPLRISPEVFAAQADRPFDLAAADLRRRIAERRKAGADVVAAEIAFFNKIALPFLPILLCLAAAPMGLRFCRSGGAASALTLALAWIAVYLLLAVGAQVLGRVELLAPAQAGLLAPVSLTVAAVFLFASASRFIAPSARK